MSIVRPEPLCAPVEPKLPRPAAPEKFRRLGHRCLIVASGPSARGFQPPRGVPVIAVNGAIDWLERADFFHTTDWSVENLHRLREKRAGVIYTAAYPPRRRTIQGVWYFDRGESRLTAPKGLRPESPPWRTWRWQAQLGLSQDPTMIHVGNSAYGALGLAYHLGFTHVATIGVDAKPPFERVEGGRSGSLAHVPVMFASARRFLDITSCGEMEAEGIPRMSFAQWLEETART